MIGAAAIAAAGLFDAAAQTPSLHVLYNFKSTGAFGADPKSTLTADSSGALYGTTFEGGRYNLGVAFKLSPPVAGHPAWTPSSLFQFNGGLNGSRPVGALAKAPGGVLYGAAQLGGGSGGDGTIFELTPPATEGGAWALKTIHRFAGGNDGSNPFAGLVRAADGTLYGTTFQGGPTGWGTVFRLTPPAAGHAAWAHQVLYAFRGMPDGGSPQASLTIGHDGSLFGTTKLGGAANVGTVFKLSPPAEGRRAWTRTTLHHFGKLPGDGKGPLSGVTFDAAGNLYGTASFGGNATDSGIVFQLQPPATGQTLWTYRILHKFSRSDGASPQGDLILDAGGNLYGTAAFGGTNNSGVAFQLVPPPAGRNAWGRKILHDFSGTTEGAYPIGGLHRAATGALYGAAGAGGRSDAGTIYKIP